ncbi:MAG: SDR family NAD(P)-dependent oxidoreductase [Acidobacteria bacterium]|nr:MAG: SDR family NAD(P)-dependent oxidoreductase [Acidobacteriota bacterium]
MGGTGAPAGHGGADGLAGRLVVVGGGAGALGRAVVERLLADGARVVVPTIEPEGESPLATIAAHPGLEIVPSVDLAREDDVARVYDGRDDLWASIQVAGGFEMAPITETGLDAWRRMWEINATSCFLCCREAVRAMLRGPRDASGEGRGRLVNVAAQTALDPRRGAGMVAYTAAKSAVAALSVALGEELAAEGIWVNAVAPSIIDTPANRAAMPDADHDRWPAPEQIATVVAFLVSPANRVARSGVIPVYGRG